MRGIRIEWSAAQDAFLVQTHTALNARRQAEQLGMSYSAVITRRKTLARGALLVLADRAYHPRWTREEDDWLRDNYHRLTMRMLQLRLRRSEVAIVMRKRRLGILRTDGFYTARSLGALLGCDPKRIADLVRHGYLKGRRAPYLQGKHMPWAFSEQGVGRFIRQYPWLVNPARMEEHYFRSLVHQEWQQDPWYNCRAAARLVGIGENALQVRLRSGEVPAFQRSPGRRWSRWWVRRSALLTHFRRHDLREDRARAMAVQQRDRRCQNGLPYKLHTVWGVVCQRCSEEYRVEAPPKMRGPQVLELARAKGCHDCGQGAGA